MQAVPYGSPARSAGACGQSHRRGSRLRPAGQLPGLSLLAGQRATAASVDVTAWRVALALARLENAFVETNHLVDVAHDLAASRLADLALAARPAGSPAAIIATVPTVAIGRATCAVKADLA